MRTATERNLATKHLQEVQQLKDQYEESAQSQLRREEKLTSKIGHLEGQFSEATRELAEKRDAQNRLLSQHQLLQKDMEALN